jgi:hypothetical protein
MFQGNALYNILPDCISRLSDPEIGVEEEHFQTIMKWVVISSFTKNVSKHRSQEVVASHFPPPHKVVISTCGGKKASKQFKLYQICCCYLALFSVPSPGLMTKMSTCMPFYLHFRYMFSFIQKDKLCESLVEKLCHRYRVTVYVSTKLLLDVCIRVWGLG